MKCPRCQSHVWSVQFPVCSEKWLSYAMTSSKLFTLRTLKPAERTSASCFGKCLMWRKAEKAQLLFKLPKTACIQPLETPQELNKVFSPSCYGLQWCSIERGSFYGLEAEPFTGQQKPKEPKAPPGNKAGEGRMCSFKDVTQFHWGKLCMEARTWKKKTPLHLGAHSSLTSCTYEAIHIFKRDTTSIDIYSWKKKKSRKRS